MKLTQYKLQNTIAAGETSGQTFSAKNIRGRLVAVYVEMTNSTPASTSDRDIDLYEMNPADDDDVSDALQHVLDIGGIGADPSADNGIYYPRVAAEDYQGTDLVFLSTDTAIVPTEVILFGHLVCLNVSAAAAGDITTVYLVVEEF